MSGATNGLDAARGWRDERADVIALIREAMAGAQAIAARHHGAGIDADIDITLYVARLDALCGSIDAGLHVGMGRAA